MAEEAIQIIDKSGDDKMLWETTGRLAYKRGLLEGRNESPLFAVIPISILERTDLSANSKLLYAEIIALSKKSGRCYATNKYLAQTLGLKDKSIPQLLKELSGTGLLMINIKRNKEGTYRDILASFFNEGGHQSITRGGIVKERGQKRYKQIDINKIDTDSNPQVAEVINLFKDINPSYKGWFGNITQRKAAATLLKQHGFEKVSKAVNLLARTNTMPYITTITTPYMLETKWALWKAQVEKKMAEKQSKGKKIISSV